MYVALQTPVLMFLGRVRHTTIQAISRRSGPPWRMIPLIIGRLITITAIGPYYWLGWWSQRYGMYDGYVDLNVMNRHHFFEALRRRPPAFKAAGTIFADLISLRFRS